MTVGALLDLGADQRLLEEQLRSLPVSGFEIEISRVKKSGLDACDFRVILDKEHENHDHDNEYLYGHGHKHEHHHHHAHTHDHIHRGLPEIREIILHSGITERAKKTALAIFQVLAEAEAKAHGTSIDEVHFHEVGAVDSIVDIVAAAVCLDTAACRVRCIYADSKPEGRTKFHYCSENRKYRYRAGRSDVCGIYRE